MFLVLMYSGHFFWMAYWKQLCAKPEMDYSREREVPDTVPPRPGPAQEWHPSLHTSLSGDHLLFLLA